MTQTWHWTHKGHPATRSHGRAMEFQLRILEIKEKYRVIRRLACLYIYTHFIAHFSLWWYIWQFFFKGSITIHKPNTVITQNDVWVICSKIGFSRPVSQIRQSIGQISHNAFCCRHVHISLQMKHYGIWNWCIVGFVQQVYYMTTRQATGHRARNWIMFACVSRENSNGFCSLSWSQHFVSDPRLTQQYHLIVP